MSEAGALTLYAVAIAVASLLGGAVPLFAHTHGRRLDLLLALSAGVMLGAAFFHMLPEAVREGGRTSLFVVPLGFLALFFLERYVLVHACQEPEEGCEVHGAVGLASFVGLSVHTLFDGVALGSSLTAGVGALVFAAVVAHKVPASFSLATILVHEGRRPARVLGMLALFSLMVPLGAGLYLAARAHLNFSRLTPAALAFSSGTFLYIALADLLPQAHRRAKSRLPTSAALVVGMGAMAWVARFALEP